MKGRAAPRGIFAEDQHSSCSEITLFGTCEYRWYWEYPMGHETDNRFSVLGREGHKAIADVNRALMANPDGIAEQDIESAKVKLARFKSYEYYRKFCEWLTEYAAKANMEKGDIIGVEMELEAPLDLGPGLGVITVRGRIDRVNRVGPPEMGECSIVDFKLWGLMPSREELEADFQTALYDWLLRYPPNAEKYGLNILRTWRKEWTSIFHDRTIPAKADLKDADDAERYAKDNVLRILKGGKRSRTFNRRCESCAKVKRCGEFNRAIGHLKPVTILHPTAKEFVRWNERQAVTGNIRDRVREAMMNRLVRYGKPIREDGYEMSLYMDEGGQKVEFVRQPFTSVRVRRVTKGARR